MRAKEGVRPHPKRRTSAWYCRHFSDPVALKLKQLELGQLSQAFRGHSGEGIVTETQVGEVGK